MKSLVSVATLAAVLMTTHLASAEDGNGNDDTKDSQVAIGLSLGGTALSLGVFGLGAATQKGPIMAFGVVSLLVTPSFGQWYAHKPLTWGMGLRVAGGAAAFAGLIEGLACIGDESGACPRDEALTSTLLVGGTAACIAGIVYDIATAGRAADDFNARHDLHVAPTVMRGANNSATVGLGLGGRF